MMRECGRRWAWLFVGSWLLGCNGGSPAAGIGGEGPGALGTDVVCRRDADCDDAVFCNGAEVCDEGVCRRKDRTPCSDGIACTLDSCDEGSRACRSVAPDQDGDGHLDALCLGKGGEPLGDDCDDEDAERYPDNLEVCDGSNRDEDCDPGTIGFRDSDNDGYVDTACCNDQPDGDPLCGEDCDDNRTNVNPAATEECDFLDNNCDGEVDENKGQNRYVDADHDGHGAGKFVKTCPGAVGYSNSADDCDDDDPEVFTGQFEICDDKDNNCDPERLADEVEEQAPWYPDVDGDGYGDPQSTPVWSCYRPAGRVLSQNDCADGDKAVNPNASELCDAKDNDCNGLADFRLPKVNDFEDDDRDGNPDATCGGADADCNDRDSSVSAGAEEVCDHVDNDCDEEVDEETTQTIWYIDEDGDGWGVVVGSALASCEPIDGRSREFGDCDDGDVMAHPGVTDFCDGEDNDCDGLVDEGADAFCHLDNALSVCQNAGCAIYTCQPGFVDEDQNPATGCEEEVVPEDLVLPQICTTSAICNDGNFCNGFESCMDGRCRKGSPINCEPTSEVIFGDVNISGIADIRALKGVRRITGNVFIQNTTLKNLVGLESLEAIGGNLLIMSNANLERLSGSALSNLETVGGQIVVQSNPNLVSADLPSLVSAFGLNIDSNMKLTELAGFSRLTSTEAIRLGSGVLEKVTAFSSLTEIGGEGTTGSPPTSEYYVCEGASCIPVPCQGGGLTVVEGQLSDISGFAKLREVRGDLCFSNFRGKDLSLPNLSRVGSSIVIDTLYSQVEVPQEIETIAFPKLESAGALSLGVAGPGLVGLTEVNLPRLTLVPGELRVRFTSTKLSEFALPVLSQAGAVFGQVGPNARLARLSFPELVSAASISLSPESSQVPVFPLGTLDFSSLEKVDASLAVTLPVTKKDQADQGLVLPKIKVVGTANTEQTELRLCTGTLNPQTSLYEGAACDVVTRLVALGFVGVSDTCGQCGTVVAPGLVPSPFAGVYLPEESEASTLTVDCAGNIAQSFLDPCEERGTVDPDGTTNTVFSGCDGGLAQSSGQFRQLDSTTFQVTSTRGGSNFTLAQRIDCTGVQIWTGTTDKGTCPAQGQCETSANLPRTIRAAVTSSAAGEGETTTASAPNFFVGMASPMSQTGTSPFVISLPDLFGSATCGTGTMDAYGVVRGMCYESTEFGSINYNYTMQQEYPPVVVRPE
jgi:hypothetical protein